MESNNKGKSKSYGVLAIGLVSEQRSELVGYRLIKGRRGEVLLRFSYDENCCESQLSQR